MPRRAAWICFDLGVKGDYTGLYSWLDTLGAKECSYGVAFIQIESEADIFTYIKSQLETNVTLNQSDIVYVIAMASASDGTSKMKGCFIHGGRRRSPWEGYAQDRTTDNVDNA